MVIYLLKNEVLQSKFQVITKNKGNRIYIFKCIREKIYLS